MVKDVLKWRKKRLQGFRKPADVELSHLNPVSRLKKQQRRSFVQLVDPVHTSVYSSDL